MTTRGNKARIVYRLLVAIAIWPVIHLTLVATHDLNPWKLAGWGMYAKPQLASSLRIFGRMPGSDAAEELRGLPVEVQPARDDFLRLRRGLRELVEPDELARKLFEHFPRVETITIVVVQPTLLRKTGMIEAESTEYVYDRRR